MQWKDKAIQKSLLSNEILPRVLWFHTLRRGKQTKETVVLFVSGAHTAFTSMLYICQMSYREKEQRKRVSDKKIFSEKNSA